MYEAEHATLEGPGSVPVRQGTLLGRGMLNRGTELAKLGKYADVEGENVALFIAADRLPGVGEGDDIQIGAPDLAGANSVEENDPEYRIAKRSPIDDGLIHLLVLEGGPDT